MDGCYLRCTACGTKQEGYDAVSCVHCGGILEVAYEESYLAAGIRNLPRELGYGIFQFGGILPPVKTENQVSVSEAGTPVVPAKQLSGLLGYRTVWLKDETKNTTGSFKDRPVSVCVSVAKELGCERVVVASSGNGAASVAAYSAKAKLENIIFIPEKTPDGKVAQTLCYGGHLERIPGDFSRSYDAAVEAAKTGNTLNLTTTFLSPFGLEGDKTIAYELWLQCNPLPDWIFIPVGAGPVLYGIYKGFRELQEAGAIEKIPRLVAVQAEGCAPIVRAWQQKNATTGWEDAHTVASAICDPLRGYEQDGDITVRAIEATNGMALTVTDAEILHWGRRLASCEGVFAEPASAAAVAGAYKARMLYGVSETAQIACVITGSGLKDPMAYLAKEGKEC